MKTKVVEVRKTRKKEVLQVALVQVEKKGIRRKDGVKTIWIYQMMKTPMVVMVLHEQLGNHPGG
jgi:hypothetical protein